MAKQGSFFDPEVQSIEPAPYAFSFTFEDDDGGHTFRCGDWETPTTFWKWSRDYGETEALRRLSGVYNDEYPKRGMVFAMGTVKARPKQWLLLGVLRLDEARQVQFAF